MSEQQNQIQVEQSIAPVQPMNGSTYFALEVERYKALNSEQVCAACFLDYARNTLKFTGTDQELFVALSPHYFIWTQAWKAKS
jgi:hypothetical protein